MGASATHGAGAGTPTPLKPDRPDREPVSLAPLLVPERGTSRLPLPLTSLVGREREVARVSSLLLRDDLRLLVLTGPGGVGKTRVALQVAASVDEAFPDGVVFVPLAPIRASEFVLPTVAAEFGLRDTGDQPLRERLAAFLRARRVLLVLDNFEQVLPAAPQVAALLAACPDLRVLVTSRTVLHVSGEHDVRIPPLTLPDASQTPSVADLAGTEAIRLFMHRATAARDDFRLTEGNVADIVAICRRVDGLPLAIELAAARISHLPPAALRARLDRQLTLLAGGPRDQPVRLQSMRDAIAWSFDLLPAVEQTLFLRLTVFIGGCTLEAAEAVCGGNRGIDILEGLASLVDASLLRQEEGLGGEPRFTMLETIREFGLERLAESGEIASIRHAHASYFLAFAEAADDGLVGPQHAQEMWRYRLASERDNLRVALDWLVEQGEAERSQRLAGALGHVWFLISDFREGSDWLERALALPDSTALGPRALALFWAGMLSLYRFEVSRATRHLDECLALFRSLDDSYGVARALVGLGLVAIHQGDYEQALALHEEALALLRSLGNALPGPPFLATVCLNNLGSAAYGRGDRELATQYFEETLVRVRDFGHSVLALVALAGLGNVARDHSDYAKAANLYREGLERSWAQGNKRIIAYTLAGLGSIAGSQGQAEQAARLFGAAEALHELIGVPLLPAFRAGHERAVATARDAISGSAFTAAWDAGRTLSLEDAVAEARTVAMVAANLLLPSATPAVSATGTPLGLTSREREVLHLLAEGRSDREIAEVLSISPRTVGAHVTHLLAKLGVETRTAAATYAVRRGLA